jgi:hypothetical protein
MGEKQRGSSVHRLNLRLSFDSCRIPGQDKNMFTSYYRQQIQGQEYGSYIRLPSDPTSDSERNTE